MKFSRRNLLQGTSTLAIAAAIPSFAKEAKAWFPHGAPAGFNGGVTETTIASNTSGLNTFANFVKTGTGFAYNNNPTDPTAPRVPLLELDANGYPTSIVAGVGAVNTLCLIPNSTEYAGTWVVTFDGTGTLFVSGPGISTTITTGRGTFVNSTDTTVGGTHITLFIQATSAAPNNLRNIRMCQSAHEAMVNANPAAFFPDNISRMRQAKPGCIRSLGWMGNANGVNTTLLGLWAQRCPTTYVNYSQGMLNPNWCPPGGTGAAMTTTNSGNDYTLAYSGFTLTDKVPLHCIFNVTGPTAFGSSSGRFLFSWTTTNGVAINIPWPSHNMAVGNVVMFGDSPADPNTPPADLKSAVMYYVSNIVDANNFNVSATSGGSSITATTSGTLNGTMWAIPIQRINVNSTGFVPMTNFSYPVPENIGYSTGGALGPSGIVNVSSLIYDAATNWFRLTPGGLSCGSPPELFADYCAAIGSMPWMTVPFLAMTLGSGPGVTDFTSNWLTYVKNNYPWMKPVLEAYNEEWNGGTAAGLGTFYATYLAQVLWGTPGTQLADPVNQAYGKWVSDLGQAASAFYGNDRTKYSVVCAVQTVLFNPSASVSGSDNRLNASAYVTAGGSPAYLWCDRVCGANYYSPLERFTVQEMIDAFNYVITNSGTIYPSTPGQLTLANGYAATADTGSNSAYNLTYVLNCFTNLKGWGLGTGTSSTVPPPQTSTCTFTNASPSVASTNTLVANQAILFSGAGLPSNVTAATAYYILATGLSTSAFQFAATPGGAAIVANANGTGSFASNTVKGMVSYEGGWSPDFLKANWTSTLTAITKANPCVVTLNTTTSSEGGPGLPSTSNPAVIGMSVSFASVGGMTQLNSPAISCTTPASGSNITSTASLLVNQAISFQTLNGGVPNLSGLTPDLSYYVVASTPGTSFQISATRGGSAITFSTASTRTAQPGWFVTGVGVASGLSANQISLDVDSSAFSTYTSGGTLTWINSEAYSNTLRTAGGNSPECGTLNTKWYGLYFGLASAGFVAEFPSNSVYFGNSIVWFVLQPDIYAASTAQWNSIVAAN